MTHNEQRPKNTSLWNYCYDEAFKATNFDSDLWKNEKTRSVAFEVIFDFCLKGKSRIGSPITQLLPFEIELLNRGFKIVSFCELNALCPMYRTYVKDGKEIIIGFGVQILNQYHSVKRNVNFYFHVDNMVNFYQVPHDLSKVEDAINCRFERIN